jgi:hypothetical protein
MVLVPNKMFHTVSAGEARDQTCAMLVHPPGQVACDTNVECAVSTRRENVDGSAFHTHIEEASDQAVKPDETLFWVLGSRCARPRMTVSGSHHHG